MHSNLRGYGGKVDHFLAGMKVEWIIKFRSVE